MDLFLQSFRKQYCVSDKVWASHFWEPTASCLQEAFSILIPALSNVSPSGDTGFYLRIAENMIGRIHDVSVSMVSCLACGTTGGVESLARVVIEGSWTTRYVLAGDYKKRIFAYLFQYTREHKRKLDEWLQIVENTRPHDEFTLTAIAGRKTYIEGAHDFINRIRTQIGHPEIDQLLKHWNKSLFERCESLGEKEKYFTHYHRLSADSHHNAEQTILYLLGYFAEAQLGLENELPKICSETIYYSAMMAALAINEAIIAAVAACDRFSAVYDQSVIEGVRLRINEHANTLGRNAGAPN